MGMLSGSSSPLRSVKSSRITSLLKSIDHSPAPQVIRLAQSLIKIFAVKMRMIQNRLRITYCTSRGNKKSVLIDPTARMIIRPNLGISKVLGAEISLKVTLNRGTEV